MWLLQRRRAGGTTANVNLLRVLPVRIPWGRGGHIFNKWRAAGVARSGFCTPSEFGAFPSRIQQDGRGNPRTAGTRIEFSKCPNSFHASEKHAVGLTDPVGNHGSFGPLKIEGAGDQVRRGLGRLGTRLNRRMRGKLATVIDQIEHGHHETAAILVGAEPPQAELAAALEQLMDREVALEDEVAASTCEMA